MSLRGCALCTWHSQWVLCDAARHALCGAQRCMGWKATAHMGEAAACSACQKGYYLDNNGACAQCNTNSCMTCETSATQCTSCPEGKYLKDTGCVEKVGCTNDHYPDPTSRKCIPCGAAANEGGIEACATCEYDSTKGKPKRLTCSNSGGDKIPRTTLDGTSTCVAKTLDGCQGIDKELFMKQDQTCTLCSDDSVTNAGSKETANCKTCIKTGSDKPVCDECLDGYYLDSSKACQACTGANCATCTSAAINDCTACLPGYFLKTDGSAKECVLCDNVDKGGREGCSACSNTGTFKCTACKPNYRKQQNGDANDDYTCTRACEDDSACGAIVVDGDGSMKYYCSLCGKAGEVPINGLCTSNTNDNQCSKGVCTQCADGYFLYMGGCYSTTSAPGHLMCSKATTAGVCETPNANSRYFAVPEAAAND
ncbi:hypothetical protein QR46_2530 [Giardia duodenalis assemblage B]|uniref:EGF-like domain-containing protein n=1 Tax=Giardia duodenalis assemblage B TaxID=1394984 RepID=A0A132NTR5_GIAIN|nr:hypothetical protein QR46_2530 [Giardia intestinalis assemblage B]